LSSEALYNLREFRVFRLAKAPKITLKLDFEVGQPCR